jgi:hypothetical protein
VTEMANEDVTDVEIILLIIGVIIVGAFVVAIVLVVRSFVFFLKGIFASYGYWIFLPPIIVAGVFIWWLVKDDRQVKERQIAVQESEHKHKQLEKRKKLTEAKERQERIFQEKLRELRLEAKFTAFKRCAEIREKIISESWEKMIKNEQKIISEYTKKILEKNTSRIEKEAPEVIDMWKEKLILLEMAWKHKHTHEHKKLTPDEWRDREVRRLLIKMKDELAIRKVGLKGKAQEMLTMIEVKNEAKEIIRNRKDLTEEEINDYITQLEATAQTLNQVKEGDDNETEEI